MASGALGESSVFHGTQSLMVEELQSQSRWRTLPRNLKIIGGIILSGGKSEKIAAYASSLPPGDKFRDILTKFMVKALWGSLLHPPLTFVGERDQYRSADGSGNSTLCPDLGKAGLPYAKTVPAHEAKFGAKPDPGDLFDMLMARDDEDEAKVSDLGISSQLIYHADLIIHDIFRTNNTNRNISDTSSYLDLSPLYGKDKAAQLTVRTMRDGLLKPDSFAEERLLNQPPGVTVYLIMYSRFHNYVARQLKEINENGRFSNIGRPAGWLPEKKQGEKDPDYSEAALDAAWKEYLPQKIDEDLFQTARLVTCGMYINIAIHDYLRVLMRKHAERTDWSLDPRLDMSWATNKTGVERGIGNTVTSEFNALYRFHSPLSTRDTKWTKAFLQANVPPEFRPGGGHPKELSQEDFDDAVINLAAMRSMLTRIQNEGGTLEDKKKSPYVPMREEVHKGWVRDSKTGLFDDKTLVKEICATIEDPLCQFGARNTPKFFRSIEILGILQARKWELATLNEFRKFFGLKRHTTFESINSDPEIQDRLRTLYSHPDMVEFHPGLWCEGEGRCLDPGASCPNGEGTALWRGVFSDAVTLVRSDRFYTLDWNVGSLTAWGFSEVKSDVNIFKGGIMGRLYQRAFPGFFKCDSIHLWQPFYTPAMNILVADEQDLLKELQPISEIGVSEDLWKLVKDFKNRNDLLYLPLDTVVDRVNFRLKEMRREDLKLTPADLKDLKGIQHEINENYRKIKFPKSLFKGRPDGQRLWRKLQFHLLRRAAKMHTFERAVVPTAVSDIKMIKKILGEYKDQFKNPGYADGTAFSDFDPSWLEECLRGQKFARHGKKPPRGGNGDIQDKGLEKMQRLVTTERARYPAYFVAHSFKGHDDRNYQAPRNEKHRLVERSIPELFYDYFFFMAHRIRHREQLRLQTRVSANSTQQNGAPKNKQPAERPRVLQLDIVKDYAIPVITRFLADFLGFGHLIKSEKFPDRKYEENDIYEHFVNCQDYLTFDADETRAFRRRKAFQKSLAFLKKLAEEGVRDAQRMWFEILRGRTYHVDDGDNELVHELRRFGVKSAQELTAYFSKQRYERPQEAAAAVMLSNALSASHKSVHIFTQVLECLLGTYRVNGKDERHFWPKIQKLSFSHNPDDKKKLRKYVLEAQRANVNIPLVRRFVPDTNATGAAKVPKQCQLSSDSQVGPETLEKEKEYILEIRKAYAAQDGPTTGNAPPKFDLNRKESEYLMYGNPEGTFNAKELTVIAITALLQYAGTFGNLREAHGVMGRVKTANSPAVQQKVLDDYRSRYLTVKWDQLVPYPTSWALRYDGIGEGTAGGKDNSDTGNDIKMVNW